MEGEEKFVVPSTIDKILGVAIPGSISCIFNGRS
jgi:hypothetical protein